ncbi:MAG: KpsF/GutQ family sugar-phosphate isomerase [candidate division Zixibacteria bacterium]|nr:KpsF/GutQ family sugar-phosphate isomerase [candidate division Zixibacteria bacterium]
MIKETAKDVIKKEAEAIYGLLDRIDDNFEAAVNSILNLSGRVIITGMGKSGIIGKKIAATLSSTGTPALFLHPVEAIHGDLGIVTKSDIVLVISKSGDTAELHQLIPAFKRLGLKIIVFIGETNSPLAERADIIINCSVPNEACLNNLVPTSSSTAAAVMGDALAVALLEQRGFTADDFAQLHPGGSLGRRLLVRVSDIMHTGDKIPIVTPNATVEETLIVMSQGMLGMAAVANSDGTLAGVFTDGDLRRISEKGNGFMQSKISGVMTKNPLTISPDAILDEVLALYEKHKITALVVVDDSHRPVGAIHIHDILQSKLV